MNRVGDDVRSLTIRCPLFSLSPIGGEGRGEGSLWFMGSKREISFGEILPADKR